MPAEFLDRCAARQRADVASHSSINAEELAYIAVTPSGFVDGACFTDSEDTPQWLAEMDNAGMAVHRLPRSEAKRVLFTNLPQATLHA